MLSLQRESLIKCKTTRKNHDSSKTHYVNEYWNGHRTVFTMRYRAVDGNWEANDEANDEIHVFKVDTEEEAVQEMIGIINNPPNRHKFYSSSVLPDKPSDLIRLATNDARHLNRAYYIPDSGLWHAPDQDTGGKVSCLISFSGAVMARSLNASDFNPLSTTPEMFFNPDSARLKFLDCIERGKTTEALSHMGAGYSPDANEDAIAEIDELRKTDARFRTGDDTNIILGYLDWATFDQFLVLMERIADIFEKHGL